MLSCCRGLRTTLVLVVIEKVGFMKYAHVQEGWLAFVLLLLGLLRENRKGCTNRLRLLCVNKIVTVRVYYLQQGLFVCC